jgi:F0F1-type ATP synthase membrane subunit b/b'
MQRDLDETTTSLKDAKELLEASQQANEGLKTEVKELREKMEAREKEIEEKESTNAELMSMFSAVQAKLSKK